MTTKAISALLLASVVAACGGDSRPQVNAAPSISAIADRNTAANQTSQAIAFTVSDEDPGTLAVSAMSENQQVVPDSGLIVGGSGSARTVTITPVSDVVGDCLLYTSPSPRDS